MYEIREVTEHKTIKGVKGFLYKCIWAEGEPTWEPELHIKATADKLLNIYWRQATKSCKPDPTPLKQSLLSTKRVVAERKPPPPVPQSNSALTVLQVQQKPINCGTPKSSPDKEQPQVYEDLETAFLANIGNWKKQRR